MLKQGEVARALSWSGLAAACGAGALLLSIAPTLAQSEKSDKPAESAPLPVTVAPANGNGNNNKPDQPDENGQQQGNGALPAAAPMAVTTPALPRAIEVAPSAPTALPPPTPANVAPLTAEPADPADDDRSDGGDKDSSFRRDMQRQKADQQRQQADQQRQQADAQRQQAEQQRQVSEAKRAQARAQSELDRARRDVEMLSKRLAEASDRLKKLEMADAQANIATKFPANQFDVETRDGRIVSVTPKALTGAAAQKFRFDKSGGEGGYVITKAAPDAEFRINSGAKGGFAYSAVGQPGAKGRSSGDDRERRLEAVERELSELLKEVRQLRDDKDAAPRTPTPQAR